MSQSSLHFGVKDDSGLLIVGPLGRASIFWRNLMPKMEKLYER
jgi:hypothetical protein